MADKSKVHDKLQVTIDARKSDVFDESDPKYRCCCGSMDAKAGLRIFMYIEFAFAFLFLCLFISKFTLPPVVCCLAFSVLAGLSYMTLKKEKPVYLITSIVLLILSILFWLFAIVLAAYIIFLVEQGNTPEFLKRRFNNRKDVEAFALTVNIFLLGFSTITVVILVWHLYVAKRCYAYFKRNSCVGLFQHRCSADEFLIISAVFFF